MELERHAYSNLEAEVGGMLFGEIVDGKTVIAGAVAATTASAQQISLTFTHEVWDEILKVGKERFEDKTIVGWYHTHPSFGLFLSEYDQFIQNNFFSNPGQVALVIDPIAGDMGWFEIKKNKKIELFFKEDTKSGPRSVNKGNDEPKQSRVRPVAVAIGAALIGGALGWGISMATLPADQSALVMDLNARLEAQSAELYRLQGAVGDTNDGQLSFYYSTRPGDTLGGLANRFWGSAGTISQITDANPEVKAGAALSDGTVLYIVEAKNMELEDTFVRPTPTPTAAPLPTPTPTPSTSPSTSVKLPTLAPTSSPTP
jgi:proteasome lid subunit RPN8/RPN11/phage tail protein X